ncbi:magnesium-transporting ATPase (P-type) [Bacillus tianshenii]|uniref:Magnesium-transporting ATPase (P-type) n=1 Tax=Sutcliffiella tianshenii TaxID=1463404 RepID=A0ABS2NZJ6_9BACI|nr:hypothetical protein [Bacillus tianshenii]MBM7620103.1 magnesium-transporting ATPase (P-type) [Bacillus tianshenii]
MKKSELKWLAIAFMIGGLLQIVTMVWNEFFHQKDMTKIDLTAGLEFLSALLIMLGLVGTFIYSYQKRASINTIVSFIAAFTGTLLFACLKWFEAFFEPILKSHVPDFVESLPAQADTTMMIAIMILFLSWIYYGISSIIAKVLPVTSSILVAVFPLLFFVPSPIFLSPLAWGAGIIWMSLAILKVEKNENGQKNVDV